MQRAIDSFGKAHVGGDREEYVGGFDRDLIFVKIMVLQQLDVIHRRFDEGFGARLAVFFQQILFQRARVDPDADRATVSLGGAHHFGNTLGRADVAGVDPQARRARIGGFQRAFVMEMDVGNQRDIGRAHDLA